MNDYEYDIFKQEIDSIWDVRKLNREDRDDYYQETVLQYLERRKQNKSIVLGTICGRSREHVYKQFNPFGVYKRALLKKIKNEGISFVSYDLINEEHRGTELKTNWLDDLYLTLPHNMCRVLDNVINGMSASKIADHCDLSLAYVKSSIQHIRSRVSERIE